MSDLSSLSPTTRKAVEAFVRRAEFWLGVPADQRERFWEMDEPIKPECPRTGLEVVQFTKANCLAAEDGHKLLREFKEKLRADYAQSKITPFKDMPFAQLLVDYLVWIDRIFFFGIMTHPTIEEGKLAPTQQLLKIRFQDGFIDGEGNSLYGAFAYEIGELCMNLLEAEGQVQSFDKALCIMIHELVHAYLHVLTRDNSARGYYREIGQRGNHGVQFQDFLHYILTTLFKWVPEITYLGKLADNTFADLQAVSSTPDVSDAEARSLMSQDC